MGLSELQHLLLSGLKSAGCGEEMTCRVLAALPTEKHEEEMLKWMVWHIDAYGDYPPPHIYPRALKMVLKKFSTPEELM